jgi:hypothetical protein
MSDTGSGEDRRDGTFVLRILVWGTVLLILFFLFICVVTAFGFRTTEIAFTIAFGWLGFLERTLPRITWNWDLVGMAIVCIAALVVLAQVFLSWLVKSVAASRGKIAQWRWRWTSCGMLGIAIFFAVGMAVGGTAHQLGWIISSNEPLYEQKPRGSNTVQEMRELELGLRMVLLDANELEVIRKAVREDASLTEPRRLSRKPLIETYHVLFLVEPEDLVTGVVIFPRDVERRSKVGGYFSSENNQQNLSAIQLQEFIQRHDKQLIAL